MTLNIPDALFDKYHEACEWFLDNDHIGRNCTLVYPPKRVACNNCVSPVGSSSNNVYRHGGPAPFRFGNCSVCGGSGYREEEDTDTSIRLRVYWDRKDWIRIAGSSSIVAGDADAMVIGYMSDLPNMLKAVEVILVKEQEATKYRSVLVGKPQPHGFGRDTYFLAFFKAAD